MNKLFVLLALIVAIPAHAETEPRCGTDAFGNTVCMDKDGVLRISSDENDLEAASSVSADIKGNGPKKPRRCGVDPFGNKVCL